MPRDISGLRVARSLVTPIGAAVAQNELDFQLAVRQGIAIHAVLGFGQFVPVSSTTWAMFRAHQHLHLETGTVEVLPDAAGDDEVNVDTEIFWAQWFTALVQDEAATRGGSAGSTNVVPSGLITFPVPILSARNITHVGETVTTSHSLEATVLIYYHYVEFSLAEMGLLLARRA